MQRPHSNTSTFAGYMLFVSLVMALSLWGGRSFGTPQDDSEQRSTNSFAKNRPIVWASNARPGALTTIFKYLNFSDVSALTFNGNARQAGLNLLLTPPTTGQAGSAWYSNQVNVAQGFATDFTFTVLPGTGGDGMAFVIQNSGLGALGQNGGGLGYYGIANSLAVEFDTYLNTEWSDPNNNHVGVQGCGVAANTTNHYSTCDLGLQPNLPITIADGKPHQVSISYRPGAPGISGILTVIIDKQTVLTSVVDLSTLLSLNGNDAWVGFTAGTGAAFETHSILNWQFSSIGSASAEEREQGPR